MLFKLDENLHSDACELLQLRRMGIPARRFFSDERNKTHLGQECPRYIAASGGLTPHRSQGIRVAMAFAEGRCDTDARGRRDRGRPGG